MKKLLYTLIILTIVLTCVLSTTIKAVVIPRVAIGGPSSGTVEVGGTIRYPVSIKNGATSVNFNPSDVRITGGTANISIEGSGNDARTIVLSNIQGSVGASVYISWIAEGVASNSAGKSRAFNGVSSSFTIVATEVPAQPSENNGGGYLPPVDNGYSNNGGESNNNNSNTTPEEEPKEEEDTTAPTMKLSDLSSTTVQKGEAISFEVKYSDDKGIDKITLEKDNITLYGFTADIQITGDGDTRKVTLSNIQGNLGGLKYIRVAKETAQDKAGNKVKDRADTAMFRLIDKDTRNKPADWIENPNTGK